jgi:hypothetical protein
MKANVLGIAAAMLVFGNVSAHAIDVDINLGHERRGPPRVVQTPPQTYVERVWVPERVIQRTERVLVQPEHTERVHEQVLVSPERIEHVQENVLVRPQRVEREWVPEVVDRVKIGPVYVNRTVRRGYYRDNVIAAEYKTVYRDVRIPAQYKTITREIRVPARYEDVVRNEVIRGHYEERTVVRPGQTVVVEPPPRRSGIDIDIDVGHRRRD